MMTSAKRIGLFSCSSLQAWDGAPGQSYYCTTVGIRTRTVNYFSFLFVLVRSTGQNKPPTTIFLDPFAPNLVKKSAGRE